MHTSQAFRASMKLQANQTITKTLKLLQPRLTIKVNQNASPQIVNRKNKIICDILWLQWRQINHLGLHRKEKAKRVMTNSTKKSIKPSGSRAHLMTTQTLQMSLNSSMRATAAKNKTILISIETKEMISTNPHQ